MTSAWTGTRVFVTGGSGFIGTNLQHALLAAGAVVASYDSGAPRDPTLGGACIRGDLLDGPRLAREMAGFAPTVVVHLAAQTDMLMARGDDYYRANVDGVRAAIQAIDGCPGVRIAVFASSKFVFANGHRPANDWDYCPSSAYGESKVAGERLLRESPPRCAWLIVRPTSIWGPWFGVPYLGFFRAVASGRYRHPRGRRILRSNGYVGNTVAQLMALLAGPSERVAGRAFFLADPEIEVRDWAQAIADATGGGGVREAPLWLLRGVACCGDAARMLGMTNPPLTSERLRNLLTESTFDIGPTLAVAGRPAIGMAEGVAATVAWMRGAGHLPRERR